MLACTLDQFVEPVQDGLVHDSIELSVEIDPLLSQDVERTISALSLGESTFLSVR